MIQILIDESNNSIFGYIEVDDDSYNTKDDIIIEDQADIDLILSTNFMTDSLYFIDGHVTTVNADDEFSDKLESINAEIKELKSYQNNDALFNLIMNGKSIDEAVSLLQEKKKLLERKEEEIKSLSGEQEEKRKAYWADLMNKEEESKNYKYYISIMLIAKDENEYIEEWIEYHIATLGVDHIYLYDNESKVPIKEYLESSGNAYMDKITFVDWESTESNQEDSLNHFLINYGDETKWIITIDTDEFIKMNDDSKDLHRILNEHEDKPYILCQWVHYGANGNVSKSTEPVMERFTQRAESLDNKGEGKFFVQTGKCNGFIGRIHRPRKYCELYTNEEFNLDMFQVNHYITKSYEEWDEKMKKGSVSPIYGRNYSLFFKANPDMEYLNEDIEDYKQGYGAIVETSNEEQ